MSRKPKRTRVTASKDAATKITCREILRHKGNSTWTTYLVQGWKENGKWQRRQFKDEDKAKSFAAMKQVELENKGAAHQMILSRLTQEQHDESVALIERMGGTYTLTEAVDFFLKHHRPPDFTISAENAMKKYLDDKERDGIRERTRKAIESVIKQFIVAADNPWVHEVTSSNVEQYLRGLRAKDSSRKATRKTWNNYRNDLNGFFSWCAKHDKASDRPYTFENPVTHVRKFTARQVREEQKDTIETTSIKDTMRLLSTLMRWRKGIMVRHYAYLYFAGIRPGELAELADRESKLVNHKTGSITIPANISKTLHERQISISANLAAWLKATEGQPILPKNFDRLAKMVRKHFELAHDEPRHSFISYHVAAHRSIGDAGLEAGNSEAIIRKHYLNTHPKEEGDEYWNIFPNVKRRRAETVKMRAKNTKSTLRAI